MPRLMGYRERLHKDIYDGIRIDDPSGYRQLFNNAPVGDLFWTNMQLAGQLSVDQTFVILAMRARTNITRLPMTNGTKEVIRDAFLVGDDDAAIRMIMDSGSWERSDLTKAFDEWLHATTATLIIGERPMFDTNMYDLITDVRSPLDHHEDATSVTALTKKEREFNVHRGARKFGMALILPVRQSFRVTLSSAGNTAANIAAHAAKAGIMPGPMVWIHLEGALSRDVA